MDKNDFIKNGSEAVNPVPYQESKDDGFYCLTDGLTKREHFAGLAMQGLLAQSNGSAISSDCNIGAKYCVDMADALLKELESKEQ